ncbi:MAG: 3-phosphoshikimate 1-carboxyvinyltransferase [Micavibrio sp. TMED27]|nr:3-phosphoshikimate 1-carboxyvinyltransferase [Micavibrio sp.]OUT91299.1 MAG: 3-phosphoshikimate 1-carboxyvinyltransferase [Micavibrio sp. TMED27]
MNNKPLISQKITEFSGTTKVPGDKSISHRALMFGALTIGETIVSGLLEGEDVLHTADAMRAMGADIQKGQDGLWRIYGVGIGGLKQPEHALEMGNSGTSTRLLMGLVAGHNIEVKFQGDASLTKRPMNRVMIPLEMMGASFEASDGGRLPLTVQGAEDTLAIEYRLPVASAQVKSAVLLAGLNARGQTSVIEEKPTRDHTEKMLRAFGLEINVEDLADGAQRVSVVGQQEMKPCAIDVPGDPSSAAFPAVAAALIDGAELRLCNIGVNDRRNGVYRALQALGADVRFEHERIEGGEEVADIVVKGGKILQGCELDPEIVPSMIDEFPVFAMAAACANGTTIMRNLAELRVKESDRLLMVAEGLKACGVKLEMGEDSLTIYGSGQPPKGGATIETALDHRIAMAFLVLGCVSDEPVTVDDGTPIQTSFPNFIALMNELGAQISAP